MATFFEAKLKVNAPPEFLWKVLIDFEAYNEWNPFVRKIDGDAKVGNTIGLHLCMDSHLEPLKLSQEMIVSMKENEHLSYDSHVVSSSLFNATRWQTIKPMDEGKACIYHSHYKFSGLAAWGMGWILGEKISKGFEASTLAFKKRVEELYQKSLNPDQSSEKQTKEKPALEKAS